MTITRHPPSVLDYNLEVARGNVPGVMGVNKFGRAPDGVQTTATDIWDRADATPTQQMWVAPTTARIHQIKSGSSSDDGDPVGAGARTVRVFGLTGWDAKEVSEDITLNGTGNVPTSNAYVIIHRMKVLTKGATSVNVGIITATADSDSTVTAQINAGQGQTQMAIYGIPSTQTAYMTKYYFSFNKSGGATSFIDMSVLINPGPDVELLGFLVKHTQGAQSNGTSDPEHEFAPYLPIPGPAIIKIEGTSSSADFDSSAGFDLMVVDN